MTTSNYGTHTLYSLFSWLYMGVTVKLVKFPGGYGLLKNNFFGALFPLFDLHSFTAGRFGAEKHPQTAKRWCENGEKWQKVSFGEGLFMKLYIFCFLFIGAVKIGIAQCSLSED